MHDRILAAPIVPILKIARHAKGDPAFCVHEGAVNRLNGVPGAFEMPRIAADGVGVGQAEYHEGMAIGIFLPIQDSAIGVACPGIAGIARIAE
ncbi:MAG: hypothetical protein BWZ10_00345 [candidate division BRC1 bacterium ADurb.BinA364]|nr:MAG: hypothetical protein BWZ10_00345 [candidate division BRC1 bacterium ADurb.BinA364]